MKRFVWLPVFLTALLVATVALAQNQPPPVNQIFDKDAPIARFPDLDQNRDYTGDGVAETKWCAPTAAANSVWYFGNAGWPELIPGGANNTAKADALITKLGGLMGTNDAAGGTTIAGCVNGLQAYFNANTTTPFTVTYNSVFTLPDPFGSPSAQNLWNWMCSELEDCQDVLPIIWLPNAQGQPRIPSEYEPEEVDQTPLDSISGHLVTMTAFTWPLPGGMIDIHDPDDAAIGTGHVFPPVPFGPPGKVTYNVNLVSQTGVAPWTGLQLTNPMGSLRNAVIVGAIVACPVPEPSIFLLLAPGIGMLVLRARKKK